MENCSGKREQNRAKRRAAIVAVAQRSFLDNGYAATSMSAIADAVGGSKTTTWSCFSSKEELFVAVVDNLVENLQDELVAIMKLSSFSVPALRRLLVRLLQLLLEPDAVALTRLVIGESGRFPEIGEIFHARAAETLNMRIAAFFATHYDEPRAMQLARLCIAAILGMRLNFTLKPPADLEQEVASLVNMLIVNLRLDDA